MALLVFIGIITVVVIVAVMALEGQDEQDALGCEDDVPCQECGKCFNDHINALGVGHTYRYPR